jgi:intracellular sulfur oxidation DsrE/DsrF family protein
MSNYNEYSDEHISAYIDGELDNEERAQLLFDEQENPGLAVRIYDARILKEKVQLAYSDMSTPQLAKRPFSCTAFVHQRFPLVAGLALLLITVALLAPALNNNDDLIIAKQLIKSTQTITAGNIDKAVGTNKQVILNIAHYPPERFSETIDHIEALLIKNKTDKKFNIEIVASGAGLNALDADASIHAERLNTMAGKIDNLKIVACAKSLARLASEGNTIQLLKAITVTPSVAEQVAKRTGDGWLYLKI